MDDNSKQFIYGFLSAAGCLGVLAGYIWFGTVARIKKCEEQGDRNREESARANSRIDTAEQLCDERHKRKRR